MTVILHWLVVSWSIYDHCCKPLTSYTDILQVATRSSTRRGVQPAVCTYLERLELYFDANGVEADRKVPVLLTVIGAIAYDTLRSLLAPKLPRDESFEDLMSLLVRHFDPKPLVIAERFRFYRRAQKNDESVANFVADLRRLSIKCEFGDFLDQAVRDRFVCGVRSEAIQKRLLAEAGLTSARAREIAEGMETADKDAKDLKGASVQTSIVAESVNSATDTTHSSGGPRVKPKPCRRCGRRHDEAQCKFRDATCHKCGKTGHISPVCRTAGPPRNQERNTGRFYQRRQGGTKWLESAECCDDYAEPVFVLQGDIPQPQIVVNLQLQGTPVEFELDTGAAVSVMAENTFNRLFPEQQLQRSSVRLKTYTGAKMHTLGAFGAEVAYGDQDPKQLSLVVVRGNGPTLLGRNWLKHFVLDWNTIRSVQLEKDELLGLLNEYADVFTDKLGTIIPFKATLVVAPGATPKFRPPRPVPYALKPLVEQELDRLEKARVLERVTHSDWAAPIVTVPKRDGQVGICGDYKVTINPALDVDQYPLPRPEDLFATLAGGKYFSTLDLSHAYNQLVLDESAHKYLTINTSRSVQIHQVTFWCRFCTRTLPEDNGHHSSGNG